MPEDVCYSLMQSLYIALLYVSHITERGGLEQSRAAYHLQVDVHLASGSNLLPLPKLLLLLLLLYIGDPTAAHTPEPDV